MQTIVFFALMLYPAALLRVFPHRFKSASTVFRNSDPRFCRMLLGLSMLLASCNGPDKTEMPAMESKPLPAALPVPKPLAGDPAFIAARDTVSAHGPQTITRNMLQDHNGNIWFASWEGIVRYDGKRFTNVTLQQGLAHFHVISVLEDKAGNLWFGTIGGGVYRYDGSAFRLFTTADGLVNNSVGCMLDDNSGNLWFGTGNGVSRYDGHAFTNFTVPGLSNNFVNVIVQDKTGKLWFGTRAGIRCYDGITFTDFNNKEGAPFYYVGSILEDRTGNLWIGSESGLYRYDGVSLTNFTTNSIGYICEDRTGNLWLSGSVAGGMALYRFDGKSFATISKRLKYGPGGNQIFGICADKDGNMWFGTAGGVYRYDGKSIADFTR